MPDMRSSTVEISSPRRRPRHARQVIRAAAPARSFAPVRGGTRLTRHFPAMEAPAQLAADLQAFFGPLR